MLASSSSRCVTRLGRLQQLVTTQQGRYTIGRNNDALSRRFATNDPAKARPPIVSSDINDEPATIALDNTIRMKNAGLGVILLGVCFGIMAYSMNAVGQAGSGKDDPLAALKQEAAKAQEKKERVSQETESTADMLLKFQAGEYDPDVQEQEELEQAQEAATKQKKAWWKFWARS
jgi:hypothetical protein